jgi:hypothetical protein
VKFVIELRGVLLEIFVEFYVNLGGKTRQLPSSMSLPFLCHFVTFLIFVLLYGSFFLVARKQTKGVCALLVPN